MEKSPVPPAHTKRPLLPDTAAVSRSPTRTRTRKAGARNLRQHEWALVHQHYLRRIKEHKDTIFIIHGIKHDWRNVHRKMLRANVDQKELSESCILQQLPPYIELRSPSPELAPPEAPICLRPQLLHTASDGQDLESTFQDSEYDIETAGNSFLCDLKLVDSFEEFRTSNWGRPKMTEFWFRMNPFGEVLAEQEDTFGTFTDRIYNSGYSGRRVSHLEMILTLMDEDHFSISHFLEAVIRKANKRDVEILKWLALNIDFPTFGARALGKAACLNNFGAVDMLLDEDVNINDVVVYPHFTPDCDCKISVNAYAQLPHFDREEPGASDEMVAHLLARGATTSIGANMCLMDLLSCVLSQRNIEEIVFFSKVQEVVERIDGFTDIVHENPVLETLILEWSYHEKYPRGRYRVLDYLLEQGGKASLGSPLAISIFLGVPEKLHWGLLEKTENINAYSKTLYKYWDHYNPVFDRNCTLTELNPLQAAAFRGKETIAGILLQRGADVNCPARGHGGVTALQAICCLSEKRIQDHMTKARLIKLFLDYGADINAAPAWEYGVTALQAAAFVGDVHVADLLVSRGADVNAPACKNDGGTALEVAVRHGKFDMVLFLLKAGAVVPADGAQDLLELFRLFPKELEAMGVVNRNPSRDFHEYEEAGAVVPADSVQDLLELLSLFPEELEAMGVVNHNPSRDFHEYEAEWADDPSYEKD